jgi:hypothetical protein
MDFDTKASNIIFYHFSNENKFLTNFFFQQTYAHLNDKLVYMFFMKSHESKFSIEIEIVQLIHIQYIIKYFIKFCNYLNHF